MTLTAATPARTNRNGHPCPSWCVTDHGREASGAHSSGAVHSAGAVVGAVLFPGDDRPEAQVCMPGLDGGSLFLDADRAGDLAVLVELLATATPEEHRELAAAIRSAAAVITGGLALSSPRPSSWPRPGTPGKGTPRGTTARRDQAPRRAVL